MDRTVLPCVGLPVRVSARRSPAPELCTAHISTWTHRRIFDPGWPCSGFATGLGLADGSICCFASGVVVVSRGCSGVGLDVAPEARQPIWLESTARAVWATRSFAANRGRGAPLVLGVLWALLPCGLLYSALLVAALSGGPLDGAQTMALFALGSSASLLAGPWLLLRLGRGGNGEWGMRLAGPGPGCNVRLGSLWMGLAHDTAPWCVTP